MSEPLVSVIMPAYNAEMYIAEAIQSVLDQHYPNFELLIINDGSVDNTKKVIDSFDDARIKYCEQKNKGVSTARNVGLDNMKGDFFCFLDADDMLTKSSLESRIRLFELDSTIDFVDGIVLSYDKTMTKTISKWKPSFKGNPLSELLNLNDSCFFGITWMIRRLEGVIYKFDVSVSFAEDLWFYINISEKGNYAYSESTCYLRRVTSQNSVNNIPNLVLGYKELYKRIKKSGFLTSERLKKLRFKVKSVIIKSALGKGKYLIALREIINGM
ncbi:glycosyltransferase family 2 protein [Ekhidna sp.]|uniref:glycosyltransferase family 2 protein n=1 Tax=Ekhidna sp. TaxID=2608089 RepID=UPI003BAAEF8B